MTDVVASQPVEAPAYDPTNDDICKPDPAPVESASAPEETASAETATDAVESVESEETEPTESAEAQPAKPKGEDKTPAWQKREMAIERDRRRQAEQRAAQLEQRLAELERGASAHQQPPEPQAMPTVQQVASGAPNMDDPRYHQSGQFDAMTYIQDVADWRAEQKIQAFWQQQQAQEQAQREAYAAQQAQREADARRDAALQREDALRAAHADYDQTVSPVIDMLSRAGSVGHPLPELILAEDNAPELIYYLGQNPKEFTNLLDMSPRQALKALGRIEDKITTPKAAEPQRQSPIKPPPKGIEPLKQIRGGGAKPSLDERLARADESENADDFIDTRYEAKGLKVMRR